MSELRLSCGDRRLLTCLLWIGRTEGRIQRSQKQLGKAPGGPKRDASGKLAPGDVSDSMVRRHLRNLRTWVGVEQGGDGQPACFYFTAALPAEFGSGLSFELFRAGSGLKIPTPLCKVRKNMPVAEKSSGLKPVAVILVIL
jgi:hypothetical protein